MKLYHWTSLKNSKKIDKEGLRRECHRDGLAGNTWCIYLCREPKLWRGEVCYEVNIDPSAYHLSALNDWEVMCWGNIPSESIKRVVF